MVEAAIDLSGSIAVGDRQVRDREGGTAGEPKDPADASSADSQGIDARAADRQAVGDGQLAAGQSDGAGYPMDKAFYLAHRGDSLARGGDAEKAATEFAAAIHQAETVLKASDLTGLTYYDAAAVYALAAGGLADPVAVETHAAEAVRLLGRAAAVGYLSDQAQVKP